MWVMLSHTSTATPGLPQVLKYGTLPVDVFFMMSGFILMHTHHHDFAKISPAPILRFMLLRFWRTISVHLVTVLFSLLVSTLLIGYWPGVLQLARSVILVDTWFVPSIERPMNGPIWSLHVEWLGYLLFPWICWSMLSIPAVSRYRNRCGRCHRRRNLPYDTYRSDRYDNHIGHRVR